MLSTSFYASPTAPKSKKPARQLTDSTVTISQLPSASHTTPIPSPSTSLKSSPSSRRPSRPSTPRSRQKNGSSSGSGSSNKGKSRAVQSTSTTALSTSVSDSTSTPSSPSKVSPSRFKLHFQGRVYRPFAHTSPPEARALYTTSHEKGLLGQPDELINDEKSIIDCPCQINADNATLMLQCDDCAIWVHARCVGFLTQEACPEEYYCEKCEIKGGSLRATKSSIEAPSQTRQDTIARKINYERERTPPPKGGQASMLDIKHATPKSSIEGLATSGLSHSLHSSSLNGRPNDHQTPEEIEEVSDDDIGLEIEQPSPLIGSVTTSSPLTRTPTRASKLHPNGTSPSLSGGYSVSRNLLSELANASPIIKAGPSHPLLTPSKRKPSNVADLLDDDLPASRRKTSLSAPARKAEIVMPPSKIALSALDPAQVPLPEHYSALLNLHTAVERALLLHLATEGAKACSAALVSQPANGGSGNEDAANTASSAELLIDMPNLATYTGIRAVVERGANKRFGPTELAQLLWLWEGGLSGPVQVSDDLEVDSNKSRRGGLSLSVSSARELDRTNGKKTYTWGIGISLQIKQNVQLPELELVNSGATSTSSSPSGSSTSPSPSKLKRYGMSVLPLWSSKADARREEMRKRLGECVIKAHEDFASIQAKAHSLSGPGKPGDPLILDGKQRKYMKTPSKASYIPPTPPSSHRRTTSLSSDMFEKGFILDALPPIPAASLPPLGPASLKSLTAPIAQAFAKRSVADADMADVERANQKAIMPSSRDLAAHNATARDGAEALLLRGEQKIPQLPKAPPQQRAMSLLERIKAKEAAQAQASVPGSTKAVGPGSKLNTKANKKAAALATLEAAGERARRREVASSERRVVL